MQQTINEQISVVFIYNSQLGNMKPTGLRWNGRLYKITQWGYHHKIKQGTTLNHIFSVASENLAFRLRLDTDTLTWYLDEISDGMPN